MLIPRISRLLLTKFPIRHVQSFVNTTQTSLTLKSIDRTHLTVIIDNEEIRFDWIFLRDSCQCSTCIDPSSKQKFHHTADIPWNIVPRQQGIQILDNSILEILWHQSLTNEQFHRSLYSSTWLRTYSSLKRIAQSRFDDRPLIYWTRKDLVNVNLHLTCDEYLHTDQGLYTALKHLNDYGLVFLDGVHGEFTVERLVERIGEIRHTFYGKSWNVKSVEQATNVAYTSQALGLHMDLLYFEAPPGLQFLHSLKNNVRGGHSYYVDSFHAAESLRKEDPQAFESLCSYPLTFHYRNANRHFHQTRSTIVLDRFSDDARIDHVNYSPPFQASFQSDTSQPEFRRFCRAFQRFREVLEDDENRLELILKENQCVIFHNRRILHARRAFDPTSGQRWLKGSYTDLDNFKDRLRIFREKFSSTSHSK